MSPDCSTHSLPPCCLPSGGHRSMQDSLPPPDDIGSASHSPAFAVRVSRGGVVRVPSHLSLRSGRLVFTHRALQLWPGGRPDAAGDGEVQPTSAKRRRVSSHPGDTAGAGDARPAQARDRTERLRCQFCPFTSQYESALVQHERVHTREKPFKCGTCDFRSAQKGHVRRHEERHRHGSAPPPPPLLPTLRSLVNTAPTPLRLQQQYDEANGPGAEESHSASSDPMPAAPAMPPSPVFKVSSRSRSRVAWVKDACTQTQDMYLDDLESLRPAVAMYPSLDATAREPWPPTVPPLASPYLQTPSLEYM